MNIAVPPLLKTRFTALAKREKIFLAAGGASILLFAYLLVPEPEQGGVELATAPPMNVSPPPATPAPAAPVPSPPPVAPSADGIILQGVLGGGSGGGAAILLLQGGEQRLVRVGREIKTGIVLKSIGVSHAVIGGQSGDLRLEMGRAGGTALAAAPSTSGVSVSPGAGAGRAGGARQAMAYRLGLQPVKSEGRIRGFAIRPGAEIAPLQRAGLRPGDVLLSVNGQAIESDEKVSELDQEIATSYTAEFEFLRAGKRMKTSMEVNKRSPT